MSVRDFIKECFGKEAKHLQKSGPYTYADYDDCTALTLNNITVMSTNNSTYIIIDEDDKMTIHKAKNVITSQEVRSSIIGNDIENTIKVIMMEVL